MRTLTITVLLFLLPLAATRTLAASTGDDSVGLTRVELNAGFTGIYWSPKGLDPYQVDTYGRNMAYGELKVVHPLLFLGEAFNVIEIPRLRIETNFGYSETSGTFRDLIPSTLRQNPYLRTSSWMTFFRFLSFRYRDEHFKATISDQRYDYFNLPEGMDPSQLTKQVDNSIRDLEVGLIGSPDGEIRETMLEIGYYRSTLQWPIVKAEPPGPDFNTYQPLLVMQDLRMEGLYFALDTEPIPRIWPMYSQLLVRIGGTLGIDARIQAEKLLLPRWSVGLQLDAGWRIMNYAKDKQGNVIEMKSNNPRDTRFRLTLYSSFQLL